MALEPGVRSRSAVVGCADPGEAVLQRCAASVRSTWRVARRALGEVQVGVGQARDRDLVGLERDPLGERVGPGLEIDLRARRRRPGRPGSRSPRPSRSRPSPARVAIRPVIRVSSGMPLSLAGRRGGAASPSRSRPAPMPSASATRALTAHRWPTGMRAGADPGRAAARERIGGPDARPAGQRVARATGMPAGHRPLRGGQQRRRRVPGPGRRHDDPVGPGRDRRVEQRAVRSPTVAVTQVDALGGALRRDVPAARPRARLIATRRRRPGRASRRSGCGTCRARWRGSSSRRRPARSCRPGRRPRRRRASPARRRAATASRRFAGPSKPASSRGPHRAGHDDRLRRRRGRGPRQKLGLLDRVGALDDDRAVDRRVGERRPQDRAPIPSSFGEREVAGRRQAAVDRRRRRRSRPVRACGRGSPPRRATGTLPPATGSKRRADRPAREDDRDPRHRRRSVAVGRVGPGRRSVVRGRCGLPGVDRAARTSRRPARARPLAPASGRSAPRAAGDAGPRRGGSARSGATTAAAAGRAAEHARRARRRRTADGDDEDAPSSCRSGRRSGRR